MYTEREIRAQIAAAEYLLPKRESLLQRLRERKLIPMQVAEQRYVDFVAGNPEDFLRFLRAANIRHVMYSYLYYTESELEELFRLEERDKALFRDYRCPDPKNRPLMRERGYRNSENTDYAYYLRYSRCIIEQVDLSKPKELRLYALVQGRVIACQLADAWLERMGFVTRPVLRQYAMEQNLGSGSVAFRFSE